MSSKEKQQQMFELIEAWKVSEEMIKKFFTRQGIGLSKFQYWQKSIVNRMPPKGALSECILQGGSLAGINNPPERKARTR